MRKFVSFVFALILCLSMAVTASATTVKSNQGGNPGGKPTAPRTGSVAVAVLSAAACTAGGVGAIALQEEQRVIKVIEKERNGAVLIAPFVL